MTEENDDQKAQEAVENRDKAPISKGGSEPAGPHAKERLTDAEKTPGTGALPDEKGGDADVGPD